MRVADGTVADALRAVFGEGFEVDVLRTVGTVFGEGVDALRAVFGEGFEEDVLRTVFGEGVDVLRAVLEAGAEIFLPPTFGEVVEGVQPDETAEVPGFPLEPLPGFLTDGATF